MKWISGVWLTLFLSLSANAIIDLKNSNFATSWTDLIVPGGGYELKILRTYNSRSLMNGIFGFGWCGEFETKLILTPDNMIRIYECGTGHETIYKQKDYGSGEIDRLVNSIMQKVKAEGKRSEEYLVNLRKSLTTDTRLRIRMALDFDIAAVAKEGAVYLANGKEVENVTLTKEYYQRLLADGSFQRFDLKGRLMAMHDKNGNFLKLVYEGNQLKEMNDNNGRRLFFKYNNNKRLASISGPGGIVVEYKFANMDNLVWVSNAWGNTYTYEYDDLHNLTKAKWPDKSTIELKYDKNKDWVMSYKDRTNCLESYSYETSKDEPKLHYWSTVEKKCGKEIVNNSKFEFFHKVRDDGSIFLQKTITVTNGISNEIVYHELFGKPVLIKRASDRIAFEYLSNGQLKTKTTSFAKMTYDYDKKTNKVSSVKTVFNDEKGKKTAEKTSEFKYDSKGNLAVAKNSDGQKINLDYDKKGRISSIEDQARKTVKITYEEKFGKPSIVTRPQMGTIKISYKPNGDIEKAESPDGPEVAMQVASTFNNLLDIIAPASVEVFN